MGILSRRFYALLATSCWGGYRAKKDVGEVHTAVPKGHETKRSNPVETLQKRSNYSVWCVCVVCTIVASIKSSLGLVVACKKVGATHSPARGCRATHSPCAVGGNRSMIYVRFRGSLNDSMVDVIYLICLWTHRSTLIYHPMIV